MPTDDPLPDDASTPDGTTDRSPANVVSDVADDSVKGAPPIRTHVRRRRAAPLAVPVGVAVLGLSAIGAVQDVPNRHAVEHQLADRSVTALSDAGIAGYVVFDGRDATVHVMSADDRDRALAVVRSEQGVRVAHVVVDRPIATAKPVTTRPAASQSATNQSATSPSSTTPSKLPRPPATHGTEPPAASPQGKRPAPTPPVSTNDSRAAVQAEMAALGPIRFGTGSMSLTPAARIEVTRIAALLRANPGLRVSIDGFADSSGSSASNLALSRQRAETVYHTLRVLGITATRMSTDGHGEADPAAPNDSAVHRAANRRVTVTVR